MPLNSFFNKNINLALLLTFSLLIYSCNNEQGKTTTENVTKIDTATEVKDIKECFAGYQAAILESKGSEAIKWVDKNTIEYYDKILQLAITGDSLAVQNLGLLDKLTVLMVRHRIPKNEVLEMEGNSFFTYAIDKGMVGKNSVMNIEMGKIDINDNFAKAQLIANGEEAPLYFQFNKENDQWKLDITSIFNASTVGLQRMIKDNNLTDNEFIFQSLRTLSGKTVEDNVWQPLK